MLCFGSFYTYILLKSYHYQQKTIVILSICRKESSYPQMRPSVYAPHDMMQNP